MINYVQCIGNLNFICDGASLTLHNFIIKFHPPQSKTTKKTHGQRRLLPAGQPYTHKHLHNMLLMLISFFTANINNNNNNVSSRSYVCDAVMRGEFSRMSRPKAFTHTHASKYFSFFTKKKEILANVFLARFFPGYFL